MSDKYELREGEEYIDEYIDNDGTHITILKDKNGEIKHGWSIEIDKELEHILTLSAGLEGQTMQEYIDEHIESAIIALIEEANTRQAFEEISD